MLKVYKYWRFCGLLTVLVGGALILYPLSIWGYEVYLIAKGTGANAEIHHVVKSHASTGYYQGIHGQTRSYNSSAVVRWEASFVDSTGKSMTLKGLNQAPEQTKATILYDTMWPISVCERGRCGDSRQLKPTILGAVIFFLGLWMIYGKGRAQP